MTNPAPEIYVYAIIIAALCLWLLYEFIWRHRAWWWMCLGSETRKQWEAWKAKRRTTGKEER